MLIVGGSDRHDIEYSKGIRSLQSRIEAQALLGLSVCVGENRSFKAFEPIAKALKVLINRALGLKCFTCLVLLFFLLVFLHLFHNWETSSILLLLFL